ERVTDVMCIPFLTVQPPLKANFCRVSFRILEAAEPLAAKMTVAAAESSPRFLFKRIKGMNAFLSVF
ncbi:MAG: hypothetical protein J5912_06410, partial [Clostridia bacterium]|nr:hypothetical protein [Clostridia bacterium]